ncbi:MAG: hypothetical protein RL208_27 [Pseudomonadota bacterium]|jgi:O-antigen ligase
MKIFLNKYISFCKREFESIVFISVVLSVFFSTFLANVFSALLSFFAVYFVSKNCKKFTSIVQDNYLVLFAIVMWFIYLIGAVFANHTFFASIAWLRFPLCALGLFFIFSSEKSSFHLSKITKFVNYFGIFVALNVFLQFLTGYDVFGHYYASYYDENMKKLVRITAITGKPDTGMTLLAVMLPFYAVCVDNLVCFSSTLRKKFLYLALLLLHLFAIIITGQRIAMVYSVIFFFVLFVFQIYVNYGKKWNLLKLFSILLTTLFVFCVLFFAVYKKNDTVNSRINLAFSQVADFENTAYGMIYKTSINIWKEYKFFGIGKGNYKKLCTGYMDSGLSDFLVTHGCGFHSHNLYLQFLSELGLFGFFAMVFTFLSVLKFSLQNSSMQYQNPVFIGCLMSFCLVLIPLPASSAFDVRWMLPSWVCASLICFLCKKKV